MIIFSDGIVLKQKKIAYNRRIITLFTKDYGKINAGTALNEKGKTKSALALRPFTSAEYEIIKLRDSYNIKLAHVKKSYYSIGEDLDRFTIASKILNYLNTILEEEQKRPNLFNLTVQLFDSISKMSGNYETIFYSYIVKALEYQGIMPEIENCVCCGKNIHAANTPNAQVQGFSISEGGVICKDCIDSKRINSNKLIFTLNFDIIETLKYLKNKPLKQFETIKLKKQNTEIIKRILEEYVAFYLGFDFKEFEWR